MTFTASGSAAGIVASTFSLTPGSVGDFILAEVTNQGNTSVATALSSSNVTWAALGSSFSGVTNANSTAQVFIGTVTSVSAATVTITFSGTASTVRGCAQEFSSTAGAAAVQLDVAGHVDSAGTATWASLTPGRGAGELYFGYAIDGGAAVAGSTSGYVYNANVDTHSDGMAYNVSCPNAATAPVWGDSGHQFGIMVLVSEVTAAGGGIVRALPGKTWLRRFRHRQVLPRPPAATAVYTATYPALYGGAETPLAAVPAPLRRPAVISRAAARARVGPGGRAGGGVAGPPPAAVTAPARATPAALAAIIRPARARARVGPGAASSAGGVASQVVTPLGQPSRPRPFVFRSPAPARARTGPAGRPGAGVASQVVTPLGSMPRPAPRPVIQHLPPSRGQAGPLGLAGAGLASGTVTPLGTPGPAWRSQPRRPGPQRALWHGGVAPQAIAPVVTAYRRPPVQFPRRPPQRASWHGYASSVVTPLGTRGPSWRPQPRRPAPARAVWRGGAGPAAVAPAAAQAYQRPAPQIRRPGPSRAVTGPRSRPAGGQAGPANAAPVTTATPRPPAQPRSRPPQRAVWHGNASQVVTPLGTPARRPGPKITSRPRNRGLWHGNTGPVPPPASAPPPRWRPLPSRRRPQRARTGGVRGLANAAPPVVTYGTARQGVMAIPAAAAGQATAARAQDGTGGAAAAYGPVYTPAYGSGAGHARDGQAAIPDAQSGQMPQPRAQ